MARNLTPYQMKRSAQVWASQVNHNRHLEVEVEQADAHQLTQLLYTAILSHLNDSISALDRKDSIATNKWLNKALAGLNELRATLRHDLDPEFAANLDNVYEYCGRLISRARVSYSDAAVFEVINLLTPIQEAWQSIAVEAREFREDIVKKQREQASKVVPATE